MGRDQKLDYIKGIAIILVILGHVIQFSIEGYTDTLLFNIIWSVQIPLFMVISGYFSISSKKRSFVQKIGIKAQHYLIPFFSCFIINGLIGKSFSFDAVRELFTHLENSLWYLFVLFVLGVMNDIAFEASNRVKDSAIVHVFVFGVLASSWLLVWKYKGSSFLGSKFIVYYSLFFMMGWLWRKHSTKIQNFLTGKFGERFCVGVCIPYWMIIFNINLYYTKDTILGVLPRVVGSILGVCMIVSIVYKLYKPSRLNRGILICGEYSLELYYMHYLLVRRIPSSGATLLSLNGMIAIVVYFTYLVVVSGMLTSIISQLPIIRKIVFGK